MNNEVFPRITILGEEFKDEKGTFYKEVDYTPFSKKMTDLHHLAMLDVFQLVRTALLKGRTLPLMVAELKHAGITKRTVNSLEKFGLLKTHTAPLITKDGTNLGMRVFVYYTPFGRAYIKEHIKYEQDGSSGKTTGDSEQIQPGVQPVDGGDSVHSELPVEIQSGGEEESGNTHD